MGGIIKVVIRFGDGEVVADVRNTNPMPSWIRNARFIRGEEAVMRAYVEMGKGHTRGDTTFAPSEYGTFVVDHATRTILSANSYSDCQTALLQDSQMVTRQFGTTLDTREEAFADLLAGGFLHLFRLEPDEAFARRRDDGTVAVLPDDPARRLDLAGVTPGNWDERVFEPYSPFGPARWGKTSREREAMPMWMVGIEHRGWAFEQYDDGIAGQDRVRGRMRDLGFAFTPECERAYADWRDETAALAEELARADEIAGRRAGA